MFTGLVESKAILTAAIPIGPGKRLIFDLGKLANSDGKPIGLGDSIVAVTHECDHPPAAADLPHLTAV